MNLESETHFRKEVEQTDSGFNVYGAADDPDCQSIHWNFCITEHPNEAGKAKFTSKSTTRIELAHEILSARGERHTSVQGGFGPFVMANFMGIDVLDAVALYLVWHLRAVARRCWRSEIVLIWTAPVHDDQLNVNRAPVLLNRVLLNG